MKVLFDVFELPRDGGKSIGMYNYAVNLWRELQEDLHPQLELVLACHGGNTDDFPIIRADRVSKVCVTNSTPGRVTRQLWMRYGAVAYALKHRCEVYFSPKGFMPGWWGRTWGVKTCIVVHDLIPLWYARKYPAYFGRLEELVVNGGLVRSCRHADQLVTISKASADDILLQLPDAKTPSVVYNGLEAIVPGGVDRAGRRYIFAMASSFPHKNSGAILAAYARYRGLVSDPLDLVICGIADPGLPGVSAVKGISRDDLLNYYRGAAIFVFMSLTEGFGFPPLEAMACGTPVLCSDISVLRETTKNNAFFVDAENPDAIAASLAYALSVDAAEQWEGMSGRGHDVVSSYSWKRCADQISIVLLGL